MAYFDGRNPDELARLRQMIGPQQVDNQIRQAIGVCWMMLPPEKQTADELEAQIRRIVDRAFQDFREDRDAFFGRDVSM